jgi:hypothetical protein
LLRGDHGVKHAGDFATILAGDLASAQKRLAQKKKFKTMWLGGADTSRISNQNHDSPEALRQQNSAPPSSLTLLPRPSVLSPESRLFLLEADW